MILTVETLTLLLVVGGLIVAAQAAVLAADGVRWLVAGCRPARSTKLETSFGEAAGKR